jgi:type 1 glutamine amidotransferase
MKFTKSLRTLIPLLALLVVAGFAFAAGEKTPAPKKIKALLVTGEGYHDYETQKKIISEGVSERIDNIEWTIIHDKNAADCKTNLSKEGWADPYDIVVYNICHAAEADSEFIDSVAAVHEAGKPAVVLHCSMHSFHWKVKAENDDEKTWVKFLGVRSRNHGPKGAITVAKTKDLEHPVTKDLPDGWKTPEGELYNVLKVADTATVLATGDNGKVKEPQVCIWVNQYGKARVFGTTLGHHNSTMETKEYLDLLANGIKWAVDQK